jgi:hypothetical protein
MNLSLKITHVHCSPIWLDTAGRQGGKLSWQACFFPLVPRIQLGTAQQSSEPNGEARVFVRIFLYIYFVMIFEK